VNGLEVEAVTKSFGGVAALDAVDLEARDGELLVVVGPSGCGKSTLLRCVAGLETVDEGTVRIAGRDVTHMRPAARNVSMVFQSYALFPHLDVRANIGFGLVVREVPRGEVRTRVDAAARRVGIDALLDRRPYQLSGGERQRVALARALVREPDAYLLDEPLSNLDAGTRVELRIELKRLHREVGTTMVHVTHDQVEAMTLGDRIAVMSEGRVRQVGSPEEVYRAPRDRFVATFLGSPAMNFLDSGTEQLVENTPGEAVVGVRPEHVRIGGNAGGARARVELVELAGSEAYVHLANGLVARVPAEVRPDEGADVAVSVRPGDVHFFDRVSGERIERP
jgi:ABC-type sugar transport system ATPase subunit